MITTRTQITLYQCPAEGNIALAAIVGAINGARKRVRMVMFTLTHRAVIDALLTANARGVDVRVLVDWSQASSSYGSVPFARLQAGLTPARCLAGTAETREILHTKAVAADGIVFFSGSLNATVTGPREENQLLACRSRALAQELETRFDQLWNWNVANPPPPSKIVSPPPLKGAAT